MSPARGRLPGRRGDRLFGRPTAPAPVLARAGLPRGERALAAAEAGDGTWVIGTRRLLVLVLPDAEEPVLLPWDRVEDAAWDSDGERLRITGTGEYGEVRPSYVLEMADPALLLQLLRERVTASIVLQRRVPVREGAGLTVIGRRNPAGGPIRWMHAYDAGLDPADPAVAAVADRALTLARGEVGG